MTQQYARVKLSGVNTWILCRVHKMDCDKPLLGYLWAVEAVDGHPFDGQRKAIVPHHRVCLTNEAEALAA